MKTVLLNLKQIINSAKYTVSDEEGERVLRAFKMHGGRQYDNDSRILEVHGAEGEGVFALCDIAGVHLDGTDSASWVGHMADIYKKEADHANT